jgi:hypothetical protein
MLKVRIIPGILVAAVVLAGLATSAETAGKRDPKVLIDDTATRQAQLKRAFESFRQKLAILAGRLELSSEQKDRDRARALRNVLKEAATRGVEVKFDALIRGLTKKGADKDIDTLAQVVRENKDLRKDLQALLALILADNRDKVLADRGNRAAKLLEELKDLRNKQARLQAQVDLGRKADAQLKKEQEKITKATKDLLDRISKADKDGKDPIGAENEKQAEGVRKPVGDANKEQKDAEGKLGKGNKEGAGDAQGRAVGKLDEAIRNLEDILRQVRKEERERKLLDLLARCKQMLKVQEEVQAGSEAIFREMRKEKSSKASLAQAARSNKLADRQYDSLKMASAALKIVQTEGSALAFAEVFEQLIKDMDIVHTRLTRAEIDKVTLTIEDDIIETLKDAIRALEKEIRDNENNGPRPPEPPTDGPTGKPKLVNLIQQLKMIHALQRRVNDRTELYGKRYKGEQAPPPDTARTNRQKLRYEQIQKELKDLAGRQDRIAKVTREIGKEEPDAGSRRID